MQEAPNSKEKDEQQERGNYDSANIWSKYSVSQVQVLIAPPNRPLGFSCEDD